MTQYPILFFAAGLGTRMRDLVAERPKPLVRVAGKPLIDHALAQAADPRVGTRVVNVHYKANMLIDHLKNSDALVSDETDILRETGGGLRHALPLMGNPAIALTMNTDAVWRGETAVTTLMNQWNDDMECLLLLVPTSGAFGHKGQGDFDRAENGRLTRGAGMIYTGVQMIRPRWLDQIKEDVFSLNVVWNKIAATGGLYGAIYGGEWCDVGQPESIAIAENMLGAADV